MAVKSIRISVEIKPDYDHTLYEYLTQIAPKRRASILREALARHIGCSVGMPEPQKPSNQAEHRMVSHDNREPLNHTEQSEADIKAKNRDNLGDSFCDMDN